ncbi:MAG: DUF1257 domain-containing protein [Phycisphaeraceae bacterium]
MSHIVTIHTLVKDATALAAACQRLGLPASTTGKALLFTTQRQGTIVNLPGWQYPVVFDLQVGECLYDNYNGQWGDPRKLDQLMQAYAVEKAKLEARRQGYAVTEQALQDGSIKLTVQVGGAT